MNWLALASFLVKLALEMLRAYNDSRIASDARAQDALKRLEEANEAIRMAEAARAAVRDDLRQHPERLRDDDGYRRD